MDSNSLKNEMIHLKNELTAIKFLEQCSGDIIKQCNCSNKEISNEDVKAAFENYFTEKKPVPIRFFKQQHRTIFMEELRECRELLYKILRTSAKKSLNKVLSKKRPSTQSLPSTITKQPIAEYYTERYSDLNSIIYKMNNLFGFVDNALVKGTKCLSFDLNLTKSSCGITYDDFEKLKIQIEESQRLMINILNQMSEVHKSVAQICNDVEQEIKNRCKSHETYSEDGSRIIVDNAEKYYLSSLKLKIDNFLEHKTNLIKTLETMITLLFDAVVHKKKIHNTF